MSSTVGEEFYFHHNWHFLLADCFPLQDGLEKWKDEQDNYFYQNDYQESNWKKVVLPHTYNDVDLFHDRIKDSGSGQKRTFAFYRNWLTIPKEKKGQKVLLEFEGLRQTCYLYVNGALAGYYEAGISPFGFDITSFIKEDEPNLIAIATDNTSTRDIDFCIAETPNKEDIQPGSYLLPQDKEIPINKNKGVGYFWNANDFNPSIGGITRPLKIHFKPKVHLTLPLYSNLETKGVYVYGKDFNFEKNSTKIVVEAEIRNETKEDKDISLEITVSNLSGEEVFKFSSDEKNASSSGTVNSKKSIVPDDAYRWSKELKQYISIENENAVEPTQTKSLNITKLTAESSHTNLRFWSLDDPYLYKIEVNLLVNGKLTDKTILETGFRHVHYDKDRGGLLINNIPVWLRGYAQRATNEWSSIGIPTQWLRDKDAQLIRESNANHIRFMHVAGSPGDIRSFDRHGIVCTQPAGDKERENFGRQWDQRVEAMRDVIVAFRNHPAILFWEAGNNSISKEHMREMRLLKEELDPNGGRFMGCRTLNTEDTVKESEYVGTMLNRHAAGFISDNGPITETEYLREEAPRRVWDDFTPPDYDYTNKWIGKGGKKRDGFDFHDLTSEDLTLLSAQGYSEYFNDRIHGASEKNLYSACAAMCWTDSAQHGRQGFSENARMSGRVDPGRIKKHSFYDFQVMQSDKPQIRIVGHWNYPPQNDNNYSYEEKQFNGEYWERNGVTNYRDPKSKTIYVVGSYSIAKVDLFVNGKSIGSCEKPKDTFIFTFNNVDITENGEINAVGYDYEGREKAFDKIETASDPAKISLHLYTSPDGFKANGEDIAYIDIEIVDEEGRICPLSSERIDFTFDGPIDFLGGYNSGRFDGFNKNDSVIHKNHVFAECGINRVFLRSRTTSGKITLKAKVEGLPETYIEFESKESDVSILNAEKLSSIYFDYADTAPLSKREFTPIPQLDDIKYEAEENSYCKILINGQEPDTRGVRSINENGRVWGAVTCILERLQSTMNNTFVYEWNEKEGKLGIHLPDQYIEVEAGRTHLLVDNKESLMDGEPYVTNEGILVMEVTAVISFFEDLSVQYDDKVNVLRIETKTQSQ